MQLSELKKPVKRIGIMTAAIMGVSVLSFFALPLLYASYNGTIFYEAIKYLPIYGLAVVVGVGYYLMIKADKKKE